MFIANISGHVAADATLRDAGSQKVCSFSVGVRTGRNGSDGNPESVFVRCSLWGKRGESVAQYIKKGTPIAVTGSFSTREYEQEGKTRTSLELNVNDFQLMGRPAGSDSAPAKAAPAPEPVAVDLPF